MYTHNDNIDLISFNFLNDILSDTDGINARYTLIDQTDCDEDLLFARISRLKRSDGTMFGLVQVDGSAALIKRWRGQHVRIAVWMIEERLMAA